MSSYKSSSIFASPRLFVGFSEKNSETSAAMSPTSILETKPFFPVRNPFFSEKNHPRKPLGIIDALNDETDQRSNGDQSRMVVFGSRLKIQIPSVLTDSPQVQSPIEFGVKNKILQLGLLSPAVRSPKVFGNVGPASPGVFSGCLASEQMELSEDYTRVVAHGPNPRTTHIFDNCIVESSAESEKGMGGGFLASCHACKKRLGEGKDIFMYRGEKAFCSSECRNEEMLYDEGMEKTSSVPTSVL